MHWWCICIIWPCQHRLLSRSMHGLYPLPSNSCPDFFIHYPVLLRNMTILCYLWWASSRLFISAAVNCHRSALYMTIDKITDPHMDQTEIVNPVFVWPWGRRTSAWSLWWERTVWRALVESRDADVEACPLSTTRPADWARSSLRQ